MLLLSEVWDELNVKHENFIFRIYDGSSNLFSNQFFSS